MNVTKTDGSPVDRLLKADAVAHIEITESDVRNLVQVKPSLRRPALQALLRNKLVMATALVTMTETP